MGILMSRCKEKIEIYIIFDDLQMRKFEWEKSEQIRSFLSIIKYCLDSMPTYRIDLSHNIEQ